MTRYLLEGMNWSARGNVALVRLGLAWRSRLQQLPWHKHQLSSKSREFLSLYENDPNMKNLFVRVKQTHRNLPLISSCTEAALARYPTLERHLCIKLTARKTSANGSG